MRRIRPNEKEISHGRVFVASSLDLFRNGAVGFIDWLDESWSNYGRGAGVGRGSGVGRGLGVALGVGVGVGLGGIVGVGEHGGPWHQLISVVSTRQPSPEPLLSLASLQRSLPSMTRVGRFTVVVMKPPELPLHAWRPAMGLPVPVAMIAL
jgi:hypothetical protein